MITHENTNKQLVYVVETFPWFSTAVGDCGIIGIYRTLEGAQKAVAELPLDLSRYADIVDYEVQN